MRLFDAELLKILKTETAMETELRCSADARQAYMQKILQGPPDSSMEPDPIKDRVAVGRRIRFVDWPEHRPPIFEFTYMISGAMTVHIGQETLVLKPGDFFLPNQYTQYSCDALGEDDIAVNFMLRQEFLEETCTKLKTNTALSEFMLNTLRRDIRWNHYLHLTGIEDLSVHNLAETIIYNAFPYMDDEIMPTGVQENPAVDMMATTLLFLALSRNLDTLSEESSTTYDEVIRQSVTDYIAKNYKDASLQELALTVKQSESSLSRQIKAIFGATFKELLLQKRFEKALEYLEKTDLSIADIAAAVGYENTSFFYRRFREIYQLSPKDFRARQK